MTDPNDDLIAEQTVINLSDHLPNDEVCSDSWVEDGDCYVSGRFFIAKVRIRGLEKFVLFVRNRENEDIPAGVFTELDDAMEEASCFDW